MKYVFDHQDAKSYLCVPRANRLLEEILASPSQSETNDSTEIGSNVVSMDHDGNAGQNNGALIGPPELEPACGNEGLSLEDCPQF